MPPFSVYKARPAIPLTGLLGALILSASACSPSSSGSGGSRPASWPGYGRDPFHSALVSHATNALNRILWSTPVDLQPQYSGTELLIHYGSPLITAAGTIVVTVKTGVTGGFQVEGHQAGTGALLWAFPTDYRLAPHNWTPSCGSTLTPSNHLAVPGLGGTIYLRSDPDSAGGAVQQIAFYGLANYQADPSAFDASVVIDTPITSDASGNLFFGFVVLGSTPIALESGIARISSAGVGSWIAAHTAANDASVQKVVYNCAPALSRDGAGLYVAVNGPSSGGGYLLKLNSQTLAPLVGVRLLDVISPLFDARLSDDGTASPTVGPDGDVYYGVVEATAGSNHLRGWMLHYDGSLSQPKIPGAFGWDDTASIVPASAVPSYSGPSTYLILTKYNNYVDGGGDGLNKMALLDPNATEVDPISLATVMKEVLTVLGPTPDPNNPGGVKEWCINTAAVDQLKRSALVNNEDGKMYRWDFATNSLTETVILTLGLGEAYTPTIVGPDGVVYAINNATLFAIGN